MEIQYRSKSGRLFIKIDGSNQKEAFERLASVQEVFDGDDVCGCCGSADIAFRVREVAAQSKGGKLFKFYECVCKKCFARMSFGQSNDQISLFPKRKDEAGNYLPNRGWSKYQPKPEEQ